MERGATGTCPCQCYDTTAGSMAGPGQRPLPSLTQRKDSFYSDWLTSPALRQPSFSLADRCVCSHDQPISVVAEALLVKQPDVMASMMAGCL